MSDNTLPNFVHRALSDDYPPHEPSALLIIAEHALDMTRALNAVGHGLDYQFGSHEFDPDHPVGELGAWGHADKVLLQTLYQLMGRNREAAQWVHDHCLDNGEDVAYNLKLWHEDHEPQLTITVTRSVGKDGAILVQIDTAGEFEPDGSKGPGLRVRVNDADVTECVERDFVAFASTDDGTDRQAGEQALTVRLSEIDYQPGQ